MFFKKREETPIKTIEIKISKIDQLFNSMDPSPFLEKDLDDDALDYIVDAVSEHHINTPQKIIIHLPKKEQKRINEGEIRESIKHFFRYKKSRAEKGIKAKIREGQINFGIAIIFLVVMITFNELVLQNSKSVTIKIISESIFIISWVIMWKPISDMVYEWWPLQREKRRFHKISEMDIEFMYE